MLGQSTFSVSLAQLRPLPVLLIFNNDTQSLTGMLRLVYGLLNCFEQSFKYSFISRRGKKKPNKQIKTNKRSEPGRKCQSGKKLKQEKILPHQVKLRTVAPKFLVVWGNVCTVWKGKVKTEPTPDSSPSFANKTKMLWHLQLLISLITVQSWPAGARPCRSSPADLQHWIVCSSFMDYNPHCWLSLFVTEEKTGFGSMQKKWASKGESCAKGQQHWPALDCPICLDTELPSMSLVPKRSGREFNTE